MATSGVTAVTGNPIVVTIHGINSAGKWQEDVSGALGVHFEFRTVKYRHYRWLGGLKLVAEPWVLALAAACPFAILWLPWGWVALLTIALLGASWPARKIRYICAWTSVRRQLSDHLRSAPGYVIAHSMGSHFACRAIQESSDFALWRVILVGCVAPEGFPWGDVLKRTEGTRPDAVRNEVAPMDRIVRLAQKARWWMPYALFGGAGAIGFQPISATIHDVKEPSEVCTPCQQANGPIHNVWYNYGGHSSSFVGKAHGAIFWLPFFWGYDPAQYRLFHALSRRAHISMLEKKFDELMATQARLHATGWGGKDGSLDASLRSAFAYHAVTPNATQLDRAATLVWQKIVNAQQAVDRKGAESAALCLNPTVAVALAVEEILG